MSEPVPLVYFLHAEDTNLVKIGWTADLCRRFDQLQTASPHKLRLLGVHIGPREVETTYHRDLAPYRQQGEWFFLTREIRRWLKAAINQHSESHSVTWRFHVDRIRDDNDAADYREWEEKAEAFAGIVGSQPTWLDEMGSREIMDEIMNGVAARLEQKEGASDVVSN